MSENSVQQGVYYVSEISKKESDELFDVVSVMYLSEEDAQKKQELYYQIKNKRSELFKKYKAETFKGMGSASADRLAETIDELMKKLEQDLDTLHPGLKQQYSEIKGTTQYCEVPSETYSVGQILTNVSGLSDDFCWKAK